MRIVWRLMGIVVLLAAVGPLAAQNILEKIRAPKARVFDTSKLTKPFSLSKFKTQTVRPDNPNLTNLPKTSFAPRGFPAKPSPTPVLDSKNNPFQPKPPTGPAFFGRKPVTLMKP
jgi:hypothetical protein